MTLKLQKAYLDTVRRAASAGRTGSVRIDPFAGTSGPGVTQATRRVPLARPWVDEREEELVLEVLRSGRLSLGPTIDRFEELIAEQGQAPYMTAVEQDGGAAHARPCSRDRKGR